MQPRRCNYGEQSSIPWDDLLGSKAIPGKYYTIVPIMPRLVQAATKRRRPRRSATSYSGQRGASCFQGKRNI